MYIVLISSNGTVNNLKVVPETLEPSLQLAAAVLAQVSFCLIIIHCAY